MNIRDIIIKKRDGKKLTEKEINFFIKGYTQAEIPDYQVASLLMSIFLKGLSLEETTYLTHAMVNSGKHYNFSSPKYVDKHSTGGVGDKVSLILAPLVASCGAFVPMISGRALGHTGGTLDKLESISGYITDLSEKEFIEGIQENGFAMSGQTLDLVPADRKIYALRDAIGTVESIPLITASILAKKIAEGTKGLVMDLKCGNGAFMKTEKEAQDLAQRLLTVGKEMGLKMHVSMTRMDSPLGKMVGNFLEVEECIDEMQKDTDSDLMKITKHLSANMLMLAGISPSYSEAYALCEENLRNGKALELFYKNVEKQGGDVEKLKSQLHTRRAKYSYTLKAEQEGFIESMNTYNIGMIGIALGGGRYQKEDIIDPEAGLEFFKKTGDFIEKGTNIVTLYSNNEQKLENAKKMLKDVYRISHKEVPIKPLIIEEFK